MIMIMKIPVDVIKKWMTEYSEDVKEIIISCDSYYNHSLESLYKLYQGYELEYTNDGYKYVIPQEYINYGYSDISLKELPFTLEEFLEVCENEDLTEIVCDLLSKREYDVMVEDGIDFDDDKAVEEWQNNNYEYVGSPTDIIGSLIFDEDWIEDLIDIMKDRKQLRNNRLESLLN